MTVGDTRMIVRRRLRVGRGGGGRGARSPLVGSPAVMEQRNALLVLSLAGRRLRLAR
jgi:hypothetical protein